MKFLKFQEKNSVESRNKNKFREKNSLAADRLSITK